MSGPAAYDRLVRKVTMLLRGDRPLAEEIVQAVLAADPDDPDRAVVERTRDVLRGEAAGRPDSGTL